MKKKIDASLAPEKEGESNIKLGRGGIREMIFSFNSSIGYAWQKPLLRAEFDGVS